MKPVILKRLSFGGLLLLLVLLVAATVLEKALGTTFVQRYFYAAPWTVALWALVAVSGVAWLLRQGTRGRGATLLLHLSFVLILCGAFITHVSGVQGSIHLREGDAPVTAFTLTDSTRAALPFGVALQSFELQRYTGSTAPMDYVSLLRFSDGTEGRVSMNRIFTHRGYRFYQSGYDRDGLGTLLSVAYDPWGIGVTYTGYSLLFLSMMLFFVQRRSRFRELLRRLRASRGAMLLLLCMAFTSAASAETLPKTLPRSTAKAMGRLYVYHGDRICPLQTLAHEFTVKLCGRSTYRGLSAEQVLAGWFFYYDDWKNEPMIKIKGAAARRALSIEGGRAALTDFVGRGVYKIDEALQSCTTPARRKELETAGEKFSIVSLLCTGALLKLYPYAPDAQTQWYSLADKLPASMPSDEWSFVRGSMDYVAEKVALKQWDEVEALFEKIRKYQEKNAARVLPSKGRIEAERLYNSTNLNRPLAMLCATLGLLSFVGGCVRLARGKRRWRIEEGVETGLMAAVWLYLTLRIVLRGYVGGHVPLSNGFETMQFLAWACALLTLVVRRRLPMALSFGFLLMGLSMMVGMFGEANPRITQLMPVLQSPLLSIHVVVIMVAYALLAFVLMNGVTALVLHHTQGARAEEKTEYLATLSRVLLYPAVFLLTLGIFIGAVWANVSWGRYWGWDAKEVWALITLLTYSLALHTGSLPAFRRTMFFHRFCVAAFLTVLITYFGVNFFLGGLHSYA